MFDKDINTIKNKNYLRVAQPKNHYWVDFSKSKLNNTYIRNFNQDFNIIICSSLNLESDFYIIPFVKVSTLFIDKYLAKDKNSKFGKRWVANIKNHILKITNCPEKIDIKEYYSNKYWLADFRQADVNDYEIENKRQEINVRVNQSKFRRKVLNNFNNSCCISGVQETDLLVASHIIPWSDRKSTRLDPTNGLSLLVLYDKLFDKGYFTLTDENVIVTIKNTSNMSKYLVEILNGINGIRINSPINMINPYYLKYHRENIFLERLIE